MNFIKRLKTLWHLSGMEIASDAFRKVTLEIPRTDKTPHKKLATIVSLEEGNPLDKTVN